MFYRPNIDVDSAVVLGSWLKGCSPLFYILGLCRQQERGVSSCAELQVFSCYRGWKEACQAARAVSTILSSELSLFIFYCKARRRRKFTPFWQKHYGNMHHRMPPSKTGWPSLNLVVFPPVMCLLLDDPKQWQPRRLLVKLTNQSWKTTGFRLNQ